MLPTNFRNLLPPRLAERLAVCSLVAPFKRANSTLAEQDRHRPGTALAGYFAYPAHQIPTRISRDAVRCCDNLRLAVCFHFRMIPNPRGVSNRIPP